MTCMDGPARSTSVTTITASRRWDGSGTRELWDYRDLLYFFTWRDIKVRYKQTFFGAAWAILQPLLLMLVFTIFLGKLAKVPSDGVPYALFVYCALVPWTLFAQALSGASLSLVTNAPLISKVYFPRLLLPMSATGSYLLDFFVASTLLVGLMVFYGIEPTVRLIWLPFLTCLAVATALGVGIWLSAINARYRDVQYAVPFIVQIWLFASPVAYPSSLVPSQWKFLYSINPLTGVVDGFRWSLLNTGTAPGASIAIATAIALLVLGSGLVYFRAVERAFADVV